MGSTRSRTNPPARPLPVGAVVHRGAVSDDGVLYQLIAQRKAAPLATDEDEDEDEEMSTTYSVAPVTPMLPRCMGTLGQHLVGAGRAERAPASLHALVLAQIRSPEEAAALDSSTRPSPLKSGIQALLGRR